MYLSLSAMTQKIKNNRMCVRTFHVYTLRNIKDVTYSSYRHRRFNFVPLLFEQIHQFYFLGSTSERSRWSFPSFHQFILIRRYLLVLTYVVQKGKLKHKLSPYIIMMFCY